MVLRNIAYLCPNIMQEDFPLLAYNVVIVTVQASRGDNTTLCVVEVHFCT